MQTTPEKKVLMVKKVAERWIRTVMHSEYRFTVFHDTQDIRKMSAMLHSFRDGRLAMAGVPHVLDLGIKDHFDGLELWSKDHDGLLALQSWFEKRGYETTGVW